jgi:hypothetical protein
MAWRFKSSHPHQKENWSIDQFSFHVDILEKPWIK